MRAIKVLYLYSNPFVREVKYFRKTVVGNCRELTYLDDRPVFLDERRLCNAFRVGGEEAYRNEKKLIMEEE